MTENTIEKPEYVALFADPAVISFTSVTVLTYLNGKVTYFQPLSKVLYFLSQIQSDLESQATMYSPLSLTQATLVPTFIEPSQYLNCTPKTDTKKSESAITQSLVNQ